VSETQKAHERRHNEGWYEKYVQLPGIDIGGGTDPLPIKGMTHWDYWWSVIPDSITGVAIIQDPDSTRDAADLSKFPDGHFLTVYASHILEHLDDHVAALKEWWRVLQTGGYLIICVPHRDLFEMQDHHPSRWNPCNRPDGGGHMTFWLPDTDDLPVTHNFKRTLQTVIPDGEVVSFKILDEGYDYDRDKSLPPVGEYSIEAIIFKGPR
jgi:SAM-dependent methyltransferase